MRRQVLNEGAGWRATPDKTAIMYILGSCVRDHDVLDRELDILNTNFSDISRSVIAIAPAACGENIIAHNAITHVRIPSVDQLMDHYLDLFAWHCPALATTFAPTSASPTPSTTTASPTSQSPTGVPLSTEAPTANSESTSNLVTIRPTPTTAATLPTSIETTATPLATTTLPLVPTSTPTRAPSFSDVVTATPLSTTSLPDTFSPTSATPLLTTTLPPTAATPLPTTTLPPVCTEDFCRCKPGAIPRPYWNGQACDCRCLQGTTTSTTTTVVSTTQPDDGTTTATVLPTSTTVLPTSTTNAPTEAGTCVDEPKGWQDAFGASCTQYVTSQWCTPYGAPGTGWAPWWGTMDEFAVENVSAADACCGCGGGVGGTRPPSFAPTSAPSVSPTINDGTTTIDTPTTTVFSSTTPKPRCADSPPWWQDSFGATCAQYGGSQWCTLDGQTGPGWATWWGEIEDYAVNGITAFQACCDCGGGSFGDRVTSTKYSSTTTVATSTAQTSTEASSTTIPSGTHLTTTTHVSETATQKPTTTAVTTRPGVCHDLPTDWKDSYGAGCFRYTSSSWCTVSGTTGPAWQSYWGTIEEYATAYDGELVNAFDVCCGCGGGEVVPYEDTTAQDSTASPETTTSGQSLWECIASNCVNEPVRPVCANGVQFMNDCWANCFGVIDFTECKDVQGAPNSTTPGTTVATTTVDPEAYCCAVETASFTTAPWLSLPQCGVDHVVQMACGSQKTGEVLRVCTAGASWQLEDPTDCTDTVIADLFRRIDGLTPANAEVVLTQVLQRQQFAVTAFGEADVIATILFISHAVAIHPAMSQSMGTLLVELISGLTYVRADIIDRAHAHMTSRNHLIEITERLMDALEAGVGPNYAIESLDGRVILKSQVYSVRRRTTNEHAEFRVAPVNERPRWVRVPLAPFEAINIQQPKIHFAYFATDNFFSRGSPSSSTLVVGAPVFSVILKNWPSGRTFTGKIVYNVPTRTVDGTTWECAAWTAGSVWSMPQCLAQNVGEDTECGCFSGSGNYGLAPPNAIPGTTIIPQGTGESTELRTSEATDALLALFGISIAIHAICIIGFFALKRLRTHGRRFMALNLILPIMLSELSFVLGFDQTAARCKVSGVFLQYFLMVSCFWMVMNAQTLYRSHMLQPVLSSFASDGLRLVAAWGIPAVFAVIGGGASRNEDWVQPGEMCWPEERIFWGAFGWPCIVSLVAICFLIILTFRAPDIAIAEPDTSRLMHRSWERDSGAMSTASFTFLHITLWVLIAAASLGGGSRVALIMGGITALLQSLQLAGHQFIVRSDGREGCAALLTCTKAPPSPVDKVEDPEDFMAQVARLAREQVLTHVFECEQSAHMVAQLAAATVRSQMSDGGGYPRKSSQSSRVGGAMVLADGNQLGSRQHSQVSSQQGSGLNDEYFQIIKNSRHHSRAAVESQESGDSHETGPYETLELEWEKSMPTLDGKSEQGIASPSINRSRPTQSPLNAADTKSKIPVLVKTPVKESYV